MSGKSNPIVVCFPFVGDQVGGAHISALKLILNLDRARFQPLVVLHQGRGPLADLLATHGIASEPPPSSVALQGLNTVRDLAVFVRESAPMVRFLRQRNVGIVHTNDGRMHATWAIPCRLAGARLLWHHRGNPDARGVRFAAPLLAHRIVCVSGFATPAGAWVRRKCSIVHSPFDTERPALDRAACRSRLLEELGRPRATAVVSFFGNLMSRKRPHLFVEAIAAMRERAPDLEVVAPLFGDLRDFGDKVRQRAEALGVSDLTPLMGFRYPPEHWLAGSDALLVPAVNEPFGRTLIEAMLLGTLVIAADSGGNPEAIGHGETGYLVPPDDPLALADQAIAALRDPAARAAITARARADALARFGLRRHADALMQIYDQLLDARQPPLAKAASRPT